MSLARYFFKKNSLQQRVDREVFDIYNWKVAFCDFQPVAVSLSDTNVSPLQHGFLKCSHFPGWFIASDAARGDLKILFSSLIPVDTLSARNAV